MIHSSKKGSRSKPLATSGEYIHRWFLTATRGDAPMAFGLAEILRCFNGKNVHVTKEYLPTNLCDLTPDENVQREGGEDYLSHPRKYARKWHAHSHENRCWARTTFNGHRCWATSHVKFGKALHCDRRRAGTILVGLNRLRLIAVYEKGNNLFLCPQTFALKAAYDAWSGKQLGELADIPPDFYNGDFGIEYEPLPWSGKLDHDGYIWQGWYESQTRCTATDKNLPGTAVRWETVAECDGNYGKAYLLSQLRYMYPRWKHKIAKDGKWWLPVTSRGLSQDLGISRENARRWLHELPIFLDRDVDPRRPSARKHEVFLVIPQ